MKNQKSCKSDRKRRRTAWGVAPRAVKYMRQRQAQTAALAQSSQQERVQTELKRVERLGARDHADGCYRGWRQPTEELRAAYDRGWHQANEAAFS